MRAASSMQLPCGCVGLHVTVGYGGGLLCTVAFLTRAQVWRVPVLPVMLGVRFLVLAVALRR